MPSACLAEKAVALGTCKVLHERGMQDNNGSVVDIVPVQVSLTIIYCRWANERCVTNGSMTTTMEMHLARAGVLLGRPNVVSTMTNE